MVKTRKKQLEIRELEMRQEGVFDIHYEVFYLNSIFLTTDTTFFIR